MTTYIMEWKIHPECMEDCMTLYASMDAAADKADAGPDCELLGRWGNAGNGTGFCVAKCKDVAALQNWALNWAQMATLTTYPVCDDNETREIVLGKKPSWEKKYPDIAGEAQPGESFYIMRYQCKPGCAQEAYKQLAEMTEEQEKAMTGNLRDVCSFHDIAQGRGIGVCAAKNQLDVYKFTYNWAPLANITVEPALTDSVMRKVVSSKPGYQQKLEAVCKKLGMPAPPAASSSAATA